MKKLTTILALILVAALMLTACSTGGTSSAPSSAAGSDAGTSTAQATGTKIVFLQTHNNNSFMAYLGETLVATAAEYGIE